MPLFHRALRSLATLSLLLATRRAAASASVRSRRSGRFLLSLAACGSLVSAHVACGTSSPASPEDVRESASAITNAPTQLQSFQTGQATIRPVVAVGRDYVLLTDAGNVWAFKRESTDGKGTISTSFSSDPNVPSGVPYHSTLVDIFHEQIPIYNQQAHDLGVEFSGQVSTPVSACNFTDVSYLDDNTPANLINNGCAVGGRTTATRSPTSTPDISG